MPTTVQLFSAEDLTTALDRTVSDPKAAQAERMVWGWLKVPMGLSSRPDPVPDELYSWAVELGAIYVENPAGLSSQQLGPAQKAYSSERRAEILAEAGSSSATSTASPSGDFPPAQHYPDPADGVRRPRW